MQISALALGIAEAQAFEAEVKKLPFLLVEIAIGQAEGPGALQDRQPHLAALLPGGQHCREAVDEQLALPGCPELVWSQ